MRGGACVLTMPMRDTHTHRSYYSDSGYAIIYTPEHPEGVIVADPMADCLPGTGIPCFSSRTVAFM
jgi:hypothetical protein